VVELQAVLDVLAIRSEPYVQDSGPNVRLSHKQWEFLWRIMLFKFEHGGQ